MNQLAITVVGDMEQVEAIAMRAQPQRVANKSIEDSIRIKRRRIPIRDASEEPNEGRPHQGRLDRGPIAAAEMRLHHLCHQVHAWPSLFGKVSKYRDS